jgi:hypothetical protein
MEALLQSLAMKYGMEKAIQLLGIDKQTQNPKYAISMGGNTLDIGNMAKKGLLNRSINAITSGGMLGPGLLLGGALGLGYLTNPLREGSFNYNPELQGQIDYASGKGYIDRNNSMNALRYNKNSILSGQNVISGFGTNDYGKQLQKYRDKYADTMPKERLEKLDREIQDQITDDFDKTDAFMETIKPKTPVYTPSPADNGGGGGGGTTESQTNSQAGSGGFYDFSRGGRARYGRGGIASL